MSNVRVVQESCGCEYVLRDGDRLLVSRCPPHGGDDPTRPLLATDGVTILPWDAASYFGVLLERLERRIPDGPVDPALLDAIYDAMMAQGANFGPLSNILAMLVRSAILTVEGGVWRFVHRWTYDSEINDYVRR